VRHAVLVFFIYSHTAASLGGWLVSNFRLKPHLVALDVKFTRIYKD